MRNNEYFCSIVVTWTTSGREQTISHSAFFTPNPGDTRSSILRLLFSQLQTQHRYPNDAVVTFFSVERNEL